MRTHITVVGLLFVVHGCFLLLPALIFLGFMGGMSEHMPGIPGFALSLGAIFMAAFALIALLNLVAGIGLLARKRWARTLGIAAAILTLFNFPVGTIIGAYALWVLFHSDTVAELEPPAATPPATTV